MKIPGEHIHRLEEKIKRQAEEITEMRIVAEVRNRQLKALNLMVACDGPCNKPYMDDPSLVTEEVVKEAERNVLRLRHWWDRGGEAARKAYLEECNSRKG